jgi:endonuclease YncB( thermonuclease family)
MLSKLITLFLSIVAVLLISTPCFAETFSGEVVSVTDGDTIQVMHNGIAEKIRLNGIDAPEKAQPFGQSAKQYTASLCFHKLVSVIIYGHDRYRRTIADIQLPEGTLLSNELVRAGYAWWYRKYAPNNIALQQLEETARRDHLGLWADANPVAPWDYRHSPNPEVKPLEGHLSELSSETNVAEQAQGPVVPAPVLQGAASSHSLQGGVQQSSSSPLKGGVQDTEMRRLQGRVDGEQDAPQINLRAGIPNNSAIMRIIQFKPDSGTPISVAPSLPLQAVDHMPLRASTDLERAPLRAIADSDSPPSRATINEQPRSETSEPPPLRPDGFVDHPPMRLASGFDDQPPVRTIEEQSQQRINISSRMPERLPTQAANVLTPPLPDRSRKVRTPPRSVELPTRPQEVRVKRERIKRTEADIVPTQVPQAASIDESLLWDRWYKHVNELVCAALTRTMPAHGNPAGSNRVQIKVWPNHHIQASLIQGSNQKFDDAVLKAYSSLDGNADLEFPRGTQRQIIEYETAHIQEVPAVTSGFNSQTIHGDLEVIK